MLESAFKSWKRRISQRWLKPEAKVTRVGDRSVPHTSGRPNHPNDHIMGVLACLPSAQEVRTPAILYGNERDL